MEVPPGMGNPSPNHLLSLETERYRSSPRYSNWMDVTVKRNELSTHMSLEWMSILDVFTLNYLFPKTHRFFLNYFNYKIQSDKRMVYHTEESRTNELRFKTSNHCSLNGNRDKDVGRSEIDQTTSHSSSLYMYGSCRTLSK